jgi:hypothetical protein
MVSYKVLHLDIGENVIIEVRKHWIVFIEQIIAFIFAVLSLPIFYLIFTKYLTFISSFIYKNITMFLFFYIVWILIFWIALFLRWTKYFLDVWYVTEKRIIDVEQKRIFHREISNLRFDKIQDVSVEINGFLATFLNYGDIRVQTAAENSQSFFMSNVTDPENVKRIIFGQHNIVGDNDGTKENVSIDV